MFPDTYFVEPGDDEAKILNKMVAAFDQMASSVGLLNVIVPIDTKLCTPSIMTSLKLTGPVVVNDPVVPPTPLSTPRDCVYPPVCRLKFPISSDRTNSGVWTTSSGSSFH